MHFTQSQFTGARGKGAHLATTSRPEEVFSLSSIRGGEGRGEEANFDECPSPRPSPLSFLVGRGRKFLVVVSRRTRGGGAHSKDNLVQAALFFRLIR